MLPSLLFQRLATPHRLALVARLMKDQEEQRDPTVLSLIDKLPLSGNAMVAARLMPVLPQMGLAFTAVAGSVLLVKFWDNIMSGFFGDEDLGFVDALAEAVGVKREPAERSIQDLMKEEWGLDDVVQVDELPDSGAAAPEVPDTSDLDRLMGAYKSRAGIRVAPPASAAGAPVAAPAPLPTPKKSEPAPGTPSAVATQMVATPAGVVPAGVYYLVVPPEDVKGHILSAAAEVGVDAGYMLSKAAQESGFNPNAAATTSSAKGLYQFIDDTWAIMVRRYGKQYTNSKGKPITIGDVFDPRANAIMGALYAKENAAILRGLGQATDPANLYLAHFLGGGGVATLFNAHAKDPNSDAAKLLPKPAKANKTIFYKTVQDPDDPKKTKVVGATTSDIIAWAQRRINGNAAVYTEAVAGKYGDFVGDLRKNKKGEMVASNTKKIDTRPPSAQTQVAQASVPKSKPAPAASRDTKSANVTQNVSQPVAKVAQATEPATLLPTAKGTMMTVRM